MATLLAAMYDVKFAVAVNSFFQHNWQRWDLAAVDSEAIWGSMIVLQSLPIGQKRTQLESRCIVAYTRVS